LFIRSKIKPEKAYDPSRSASVSPLAWRAKKLINMSFGPGTSNEELKASGVSALNGVPMFESEPFEKSQSNSVGPIPAIACARVSVDVENREKLPPSNEPSDPWRVEELMLPVVKSASPNSL